MGFTKGVSAAMVLASNDVYNDHTSNLCFSRTSRKGGVIEKVRILLSL